MNKRLLRDIGRLGCLLVFMAFLAVGAFYQGGCTGEPGILSNDPPADTSFLKIFNLGYNAWNQDGSITAGVHVWWWETFVSNYSKNCQMNRYILLGRHGDTLYDKSYTTRIMAQDDTLSNRTKAIKTGETTVDGTYRLKIFYRHSGRYFTFDTSFAIIVDDDDGGT